jgi:putative membrane protein
MRSRVGLSATLAGGFLLAGLVVGCQQKPKSDQSTGMARTEVEGDTAAPAGGATGEAAWSDANIVALLDHANEADSTAGAVAAKKATNPQVKQFARLMMGEHHALREQGKKLAGKLNVTPQPPVNDPVTQLASAETSALESAPKGAAFDSTYIDQEIKAHEAVLDLASRAHDSAQNPELKTLIEKAKPVIEKHLNQAKDIQGKLGK